MRVQAGVSLIEAMVALVLLAVGLLAVASTGVRSAELLRRADARQAATLAAVAVLDSLTQLERPTSGTARRDGYTLAWQSVIQGAICRIELLVRYTDGGSLREDTFAAVAGRWPARLLHVP